MELEVDTLRKQARERNEKLVVRLQDELDRMLKILAHCREAFENELNEGMGYKRLGVSDKTVKKAKELAAMMGTVTEAKIRFDRAQKQLADNMTPEEEQKAVLSYIMSLDQKAYELFSEALRQRRLRREAKATVVEETRVGPDPTE